jgi:hypothetical protein
MKKIKYMTCRMTSCSNRVIELKLKMLILKRFVMKNFFFHVRIKILMLNLHHCPRHTVRPLPPAEPL